jgi:hypothetical protein
VWLIYIDDSGDQYHAVFSAIAIHQDAWKKFYHDFKAFRADMRKEYGLFVKKEWHATEFLGGRGHISDRVVRKYDRNVVFQRTLTFLAGSGARLFPAKDSKNLELRIFERLLTRIDRTMEEWKDVALVISDPGKEGEYRKLLRKMGVYNPIPSAYGVWLDTGNFSKNIPTNRIVEDIFFRDSASSYFIQLADFCAYALFRSEEVLPSRNKYKLHEAFDILAPICIPEIFKKDPRGLGIIRGG